jgi:hypothetical protein
MAEPSQARNVAAWVAAIVTFFGVMLIADKAGDALRVPTSIYVGLHTVHLGAGAEDETDTVETTYGMGTMILSVLAGISVLHLVAGERFSPEARALFLGWLTGAVIVTIGSVVLWKLFHPVRGSGGFVFNGSNVALVGLAAFAGSQLAKSLERKARRERNQLSEQPKF